MIKYLASTLGQKIAKVDIIRETEHQVIFAHNYRKSKIGKYHCYFDTWIEAQIWLASEAQNEVDNVVSKFFYVINRFIDIGKMREDK